MEKNKKEKWAIKNAKKWEQDAIEWFWYKFDTVTDVHRDRSFIEGTGKIGGDQLTFRYWNTGMITER